MTVSMIEMVRRSLVGLTLAAFATHAFAQNFFTGLLGPSALSETDVKAQADKFATGREEKLRPFFYKLYAEGEWNAALNSNMLGLAAMSIGEFEVAEKAFDEAIGRINAVFADDPNAAQARKYWSEEKVKDFKGDIHERAMAFYYRGLLFLRAGDYQNASASFRSADFQDTLSGSEIYQGDFALMNYLAGWSNWCDGNETFAKDLLQRAYAVETGGGKGPFFAGVQASSVMPNFLVLSDLGIAPAKYGDGKYKELLKYRSLTEATTMPVLNIAGDAAQYRRLSRGIAADVEYQATNRGGRQMDAVLGEKAQFKNNMEAASEAGAAVGVAALNVGAMTGDRDALGVAGLAMLFSLATKAAEQATTPAADLRTWQALPRYIGVDAVVRTSLDLKDLRVSPEASTVTVAPQMLASKGRCGFAWSVAGSLPIEASAGGTVTLGQPVVVEAGRVEKNKVFRSTLHDKFGAVGTR